MTVKYSKYLKTNNVIPLYFIFSKVNWYFGEMNKNKCLTVVSTNESKELIKTYEELWSKFRGLIRPITKNSEDYDEKYMEIKFNSDEE